MLPRKAFSIPNLQLFKHMLSKSIPLLHGDLFAFRFLLNDDGYFITKPSRPLVDMTLLSYYKLSSFHRFTPALQRLALLLFSHQVDCAVSKRANANPNQSQGITANVAVSKARIASPLGVKYNVYQRKRIGITSFSVFPPPRPAIVVEIEMGGASGYWNEKRGGPASGPGRLFLTLLYRCASSCEGWCVILAHFIFSFLPAMSSQA